MNKLISFIKENFDDIIKPVIVLLAICIVIPLALSVTNMVTADKITKLENENKLSAMKKLVAADKYEDLTYTDENTTFQYNSALEDGKVKAYIFTTTAKGYGGDLKVMSAISTEDSRIIAIEILDITNETPGLGQNVGKPAFYSQLSGKTKGITVVKNGAEGTKNEIDAVTGATISSRGVAAAVEKAFEGFELVHGKKSNKTEVTADEK